MTTKSEPKGILAIASQTDTGDAESTSEDDLEGFAYRVTLHSGVTFEAISKHEPVKLASIWQKARQRDEVIAWNGDQFTEAKQVAHFETVLDEEDDEGIPKAQGAGTETSVPTPVGIAASLQPASGVAADAK